MARPRPGTTTNAHGNGFAKARTFDPNTGRQTGVETARGSGAAKTVAQEFGYVCRSDGVLRSRSTVPTRGARTAPSGWSGGIWRAASRTWFPASRMARFERVRKTPVTDTVLHVRKKPRGGAEVSSFEYLRGEGLSKKGGDPRGLEGRPIPKVASNTSIPPTPTTMSA